MDYSPYSKENVRKAIQHYLLGRSLASIASFASIILLVRFMALQGYAGFTAITGLIALSGILAGLGLDRTIARYLLDARLERITKQLGHFIWCITAIKLLSKGSVVLTDRLHGHILSILIVKPHVIVDNSYGKISDFYQAWTFRNTQSLLVSDLTTLHAEAEKLDAFINVK